MADTDDITTSGFQISINGQTASDDIADSINSVQVQYELNKPTMFSFQFDIFNADQGSWQGIELEIFKLGDNIKISMGIDNLIEMMTGVITAIEPNFDEEYAYMTVRGFDAMYLMRFGTRLHPYVNKTDNAIVKYLADKVKLTALADAPTTKYPYLLQNNQSDYEFLLERAARIGYEVRVEKEKLLFKKSQEGKSPVMTLELGVNLDRFSASLKALTQGESVEIRGWDQNGKQAINSIATQGSEISKMGGKQSGYTLTQAKLPSSAMTISSSTAVSPADARNMAKAEYNYELETFIEGNGETSGAPEIITGYNIELKGLGEKFSGTYYITSATHTCDEQGYITNFNVRRTAV